MQRILKVNLDRSILSSGTIPFGTTISSGGSDGTLTLGFDDEQGLDSVAGKLGKERLAACNRIVEDVLNGKKWVVEIVGKRTTDDYRSNIGAALINTVYARSTGSVPLASIFSTVGLIGEPFGKGVEDELVQSVDMLSALDLAILDTPEWYTEMVNYPESSNYSRKSIMCYRRLMRLLRTRLLNEEAGYRFVSLKFPRWQFPGVRWVKRMQCKISNRKWRADLEFCEGSKETCSEPRGEPWGLF